MKIAITSDSHGSLDRLDLLLKNLSKNKVEYLFHAGDLASYGVDEIFEQYPEISIYISRGNCDVNEEIISKIKDLENCEIKDVIQKELLGLKIVTSHVQGFAQKSVKDGNIYIHGHTHRAKKEIVGDRLILNPGALCEDGYFFILEIPNMKIERRRFNENF